MLEKLRKAMKTADIDMLLIPSADPHGSEYPEEYFKARKHFSGFTGSAGTLLIWQGGRRALDRRTVFSSGGAAA